MEEIPNKNIVNVNVEMMSFKKFAQSNMLVYSKDTIKLNGTFKEEGNDTPISGDIFEAHKLGRLSIEEIYKVYLKWFNHTRYSHEKEREFVSVKLVEDKITD